MQTFRMIGIIGDPIEHSLSPVMQNAAFRKANLPFVYLPFRVASGELKSFLEKAVRWKMAGLNVTIPHKETILRFLDRLSPEAASIGAVNTILIKGGRLIGSNTDSEGYLRSLREESRFHPRRKTVLILGAGGAARALLHGLAKAGAEKIFLSNRTDDKAVRLACRMQPRFPKVRIEAIPFVRREFESLFPSVDLLVNATSVGLFGTRFRGLPLASLPKGAVVSDLVYRPLLTPLLEEAKKKGFKIVTGLGMLLYQGASSFKLWTGKNPDLKVMKKALLDALR